MVASVAYRNLSRSFLLEDTRSRQHIELYLSPLDIRDERQDISIFIARQLRFLN
jgi:hypothetical protein